MAAEIIEVAGRRWIAGLRWQDCSPRPRTAELREIGDELGMSWAAPRTLQANAQAGFCKPLPGQKLRGLSSLAAAVASAYAEPWLGVYKIGPNRWFYIAVRDHYGILPDGDVVGDETAIAKAQAEHENYDGWEIMKGSLADLEPFLAVAREKKRIVPVRSLEPISPWRVVLPPVLGVSVAIGGLIAWQDHEAAVRKAREARLAAERAREAAAQRAVSPLKRTPEPGVWLAACRKAVIDRPLSIDGWSLSGVSCGARAATLVWDRMPGATVLSRPPGSIVDHGNKVDRVIPLGPMRPGPDNAAGVARSKVALYGLLQGMGVQASISAPARPASLPGAKAKHGPPPIPTAHVRFTVPIAPWDVSFAPVPGLRISSVTQVKNGWQIMGAIYGR